MNKLTALILIVLICFSLFSCAADQKQPETTEVLGGSSASGTRETAGDDLANAGDRLHGIFTVDDACDRFREVRSLSRYEYLTYIDAETEKIKNEAHAIYNETVEALQSLYYELLHMIEWRFTYEEYCAEFVRPFMTYYEEAFALTEKARDVFYKTSEAPHYGGNICLNYAALWEYARYVNLRNELLDAKRVVSGEDRVDF